MNGQQVKIISNDENNGKIGTVEKQHRDGSYAVYIEGDDDAKMFEQNELVFFGAAQEAAETKHVHAPQKLEWGGTLYVCVCGARQQKSKIVDGKKVEVWKMETEKEKSAREHAIEMLQTEGYGYDGNQSDAEDQYDGGRGAGSLGQPID